MLLAMNRWLSFGCVLLVSATTVGDSDVTPLQKADAESRMIHFMSWWEVNFPERYAVKCDVSELLVIEDQDRIESGSVEHVFVCDKAAKFRYGFMDGNFMFRGENWPQKKQLYFQGNDIWARDGDQAWQSIPLSDVARGPGVNVFDPHNLFSTHNFYLHYSVMYEFFGRIKGADCVRYSADSDTVSTTWSLLKGANSPNVVYTLLFDKKRPFHPPPQIQLHPSLRGNWSEKDFKQRQIESKMNVMVTFLIDWKPCGPDLWVPSKIHMVSGKPDNLGETIIKMQWVLGERIPKEAFMDPRSADYQFPQIEFSDDPKF